MDLKTLWENFDVIAEAENGIQQLRELILDLALTGKLATGNLISESAYEDIKNSRECDEVFSKETNKNWNNSESFIVSIPNNWLNVTLKQLGNWAIGNGFPKRYQGQTHFKFPFCKVSDMSLPSNDKFILKTNNTIDEEIAKEIKAKFHPKGTVIFPKIGGAIATNKRRILTQPTAIDNNCIGIIPYSFVFSEWLYLLLLSIDLTKYQSGTSVPAISQKNIGEISVNLPPFAEQKRIVEKVDELMALCDRAQASKENRNELQQKLRQSAIHALETAETEEEFNKSWHFVRDNLHDLTEKSIDVNEVRQLILILAVKGRLVAHNTDDKDIAVTLSEVAKKKQELITQKVIKKQWKFNPISQNEQPFLLPKKWKWVHLLDCVERVTVGHVGSVQNRYVDKGIPFLRSQNVRENCFDSSGLVYINPGFHEELKKSKLAPGDVVVVRSGNVGTACVIPETLSEANCADLVAIKQPMAIIPQFLSYYINSAAKSHVSWYCSNTF